MTAYAALLAKDTLRVLPVFFPLLLLAAVAGPALSDPETSIEPAIVLATLLGGALGAVQGSIARRDRVDAFFRHRPVSSWWIESISAVVGLFGACLLVGVLWTTQSWWLSRMDPLEIENALITVEPRSMAYAGSAFWFALMLWSSMVWAATRFSVATAGIVAPIVMTASVFGLFVAIHALAQSVLGAAVAALVLVVYHGVRQATPRGGSRSIQVRAMRVAGVFALAAVLVMGTTRLARAALGKRLVDRGGIMALDEGGKLRHWRLEPRPERETDVRFLSADARRAGDVILLEAWRNDPNRAERYGPTVLNTSMLMKGPRGFRGVPASALFPLNEYLPSSRPREAFVTHLNFAERRRKTPWHWSIENGRLSRRPATMGVGDPAAKPVWAADDPNAVLPFLKVLSDIRGPRETFARLLLDPRSSEFVILRFEPAGDGQPLQPSVHRTAIVPPIPITLVAQTRRIASTPDVYRALIGNRYFELNPAGDIVRSEVLDFAEARTLRVLQDYDAGHGTPDDWTPRTPTTLVRYVRLPPIRPDRINLGVSVIPSDGSRPYSIRAQYRPTTNDQQETVTAMGAMAIANSPVSNVIAALSNPIEDEVEYARRIVRDPLFAGGEALGWLALSVILSALAALWAHRQARRRCASRRAVWVWTVAVLLLGPVGAICLRLSIPWVAVENGRAVNLESPDWPEPARTGTEVFA